MLSYFSKYWVGVNVIFDFSVYNYNEVLCFIHWG